MSSHIDRIKAEKAELILKLGKLREFMEESRIFRDELDDVDRGLLYAQESTMTAYLNILMLRLDR